VERLGALSYRSVVVGTGAIAEGVETRGQSAILGSLGCTYAQGYWWSRPQAAFRVDDIYRHGLRQPVDRAHGPANSPTPGDHRAYQQAIGMVRAGASLHTIAAALNAAGERTNKGARWHAATVSRLIERKG
jgi:hypothetical protein